MAEGDIDSVVEAEDELGYQHSQFVRTSWDKAKNFTSFSHMLT